MLEKVSKINRHGSRIDIIDIAENALLLFVAFFDSVRLRVKLRLARAEGDRLIGHTQDFANIACYHGIGGIVLARYWEKNVSFHKVYGEGQTILLFTKLVTCKSPSSPNATRSTWLGKEAYPAIGSAGIKSLLPGSIPSCTLESSLWQSLLCEPKNS